MSPFIKDLKLVYGLDVPTDVTDEWLKTRRLKRYYTCHACGKAVDIWHARHIEQVFGKRIVCPMCVKVWSNTFTEDAYPIPIN